MHFPYIIYSLKLDRFYVGETTDVEKRMHQHNTGYYENAFSKAAQDWKIQLIFQTADRESAILLERFIKKMKSKVFVKKVIQKPGILSDILRER